MCVSYLKIKKLNTNIYEGHLRTTGFKKKILLQGNINRIGKY